MKQEFLAGLFTLIFAGSTGFLVTNKGGTDNSHQEIIERLERIEQKIDGSTTTKPPTTTTTKPPTTTTTTTNTKPPATTTNTKPPTTTTTKPLPTTTQDPAPNGELLYSTDFNDWSGVYTDSGRFQESGGGQITLEDGYARMRIPDSSSDTTRAEVIPRFRDITEGDDLWFGLRTRLSTGYPTNESWQLITQWKNEGTGSPPIQLTAQDGAYSLVGHNDGGGVTYRHDLGPIVTDQWVHWQIHIKFSSSGGEVEVWKDGAQVLTPTSAETLFSGRTSYAKVGYYRDEEISTDGSAYHDFYKIGTTRSIVE